VASIPLCRSGVLRSTGGDPCEDVYMIERDALSLFEEPIFTGGDASDDAGKARQ
jgi:hypothetical protein